MNKKELKLKRNETARVYHVPSMPNFTRRKPNAIHFSPSNSLRHELSKAQICYELQKEKKQFVTEAVENKTDLRRDIVCLDDQEIYEVDDSKSKRGRRHPKNINVYWYDLGRYRNKDEAEADAKKLEV